MDSDTRVLQDVIAELKASSVLHHAKLSVVVQDGVVNISGRVNVLAERKAIERAADRVAGIRTLILEIGTSAKPDIVLDTIRRHDPELT